MCSRGQAGSKAESQLPESFQCCLVCVVNKCLCCPCTLHKFHIILKGISYLEIRGNDCLVWMVLKHCGLSDNFNERHFLIQNRNKHFSNI